MATGGLAPVRDPAIQIDQRGAQRGRIGPVEGMLAAVALPGIGILRWEGPTGCWVPPKW
jgi:hypothetical protein